MDKRQQDYEELSNKADLKKSEVISFIFKYGGTGEGAKLASELLEKAR